MFLARRYFDIQTSTWKHTFQFRERDQRERKNEKKEEREVRESEKMVRKKNVEEEGMKPF